MGTIFIGLVASVVSIIGCLINNFLSEYKQSMQKILIGHKLVLISLVFILIMSLFIYFKLLTDCVKSDINEGKLIWGVLKYGLVLLFELIVYQRYLNNRTNSPFWLLGLFNVVGAYAIFDAILFFCKMLNH